MASLIVPITSTGPTFPTDFNLIRCNLISVTGQALDVHHLMLELSVWEDIDNATVSGTIMLCDATNLIHNFPITCFEQLDIAFQTPGQQVWSMTFEIYKISDRKNIKEREQVYTLHLVAKEQIDNLKVRVSKSYKGKLISDMVSDLHTKWLGGRSINIETTKFTHHVVIPDLHPMHAINWLATRANPAGWLGSNYLYYQDRDGFNFVTGETLLSQSTSDTYVIQPANVRMQNITDGYTPRDLQRDMKAVQEWAILDHVDIIQNMQSGMYGSELITHDLATKQWSRTTFDYVPSYPNYQHLYSNMLFSQARPDNRDSSKAIKKFHSVGQQPFPFRPDSWLPIRISQLRQMHSVTVQITVPGDTTKKAGMVVDLLLPSPEPLINNQIVYDKFYRGRYIIASVRHSILQDQFKSSYTLIKDSVFTSYP